MIVGALGKTVFVVSSEYVKTINDLAVSRGVEYASHQIIKNKAKLEYLNPRLSDLTFKIILSATFRVNPLGAAKELEGYMTKGEVLRFVLGMQSKGKFVITDLKEIHKKFSPIGTVMFMELEVTLKEYN
ncbi:phage tail protein [Cetobacterium sp. ZOR0034]|uniref:phage tail protein n=1 Tax=Cetobacterium sp. ZOR0034 TaxID=1339239 RepID=UPI000648C55C|nr:phage tail protein [Cetobacterium sp. ZOR0034]